MVKVVKRMVEERRGRLGFVEEKQHRKRSRPVPVPSSGPAPLLRSTRLNPNRDAVEIRNDDPEKQRGIHPKSMHDEYFDSYADSELDCIPYYKKYKKNEILTKEDCVRYHLNPDVYVGHRPPRPFICGSTRSFAVRYEDELEDCKQYSQLAIDEYHRRLKNENPQLEFVELLTARFKISDIVRYYITFEAKDIAAGGQTKTYQAVVRIPFKWDGDVSVLCFRECEQEQGSGKIRGKEWCWEVHTAVRPYVEEYPSEEYPSEEEIVEEDM
ncbi:uncharacterized protein LOC132168636 [Corylus avellana]|uniref:uncharacterized protein LOC132168636 n=1 Tax=Corylus avellana TaxID=13451 RepID=UPI00286BB309|nr:uncharacterized protein LOC132168636 [Corylus avellana]